MGGAAKHPDRRAIAIQHREDQSLNHCLTNGGRLALDNGQHVAARLQCTKAVKACNGPFSSATLTAFALLQRGECRLDEGEFGLAMVDFEQALVSAQKVGYPEFVGMAQFGLARAAHGQGKRDVAQRIAD